MKFSLWMAAALGLASCSHETTSRQVSSTNVSDDDFATVLGDFGISREEAMGLKAKYDADTTPEGWRHYHQKYLTCKQAGSSEEKPLALHEQCDRAGEKGLFLNLGERIQKLQEKNKSLHEDPAINGKYVFRGFHAKAHGCLYGTVNVTDPSSRPEWTRVGVFKEKKSWLSWTRYSNGSGLIHQDYKTEPRGMAVKLLGVKGERATIFGNTKFEKTTQDFLMTNKPTATTPDPETFIEFGEATAYGTGGQLVHFGPFALKHRWIVPILAGLKKKAWVPNIGAVNYWSGVPISLGKDKDGKRFPAKFLAKPCTEAPYIKYDYQGNVTDRDRDVIAEFSHAEKNDEANKDYGRLWLKKLAAKYDVCYDLYFQEQTDVDKTSIEDGINEWKEEDSKPYKVAQIIMPKQDFDNPEQNSQCERMRFNPWNALEEHTPMSDTNQARGVVYFSSAHHREGHDWTHAPATVEPRAEDHPLYEAR